LPIGHTTRTQPRHHVPKPRTARRRAKSAGGFVAVCLVALRKTLLMFPVMVVLATIGGLSVGMTGWGATELRLSLYAALLCLPAVFALYLVGGLLIRAAFSPRHGGGGSSGAARVGRHASDDEGLRGRVLH
jgi:hypothetical protein